LKGWKLFFPRLRCPHCGERLVGMYFFGQWHVPRNRKKTRGGETREGGLLPSDAVDRDED